MSEWPKLRLRNKRIRDLLAAGESLCQVAKLVGCSKSTVSYYREYSPGHSDETRQRISRAIIAANKVGNHSSTKRWRRLRLEAAAEAATEWETAKNDPILVGFLGMYWGEGYKRGHSIGIVNTDPGIIVAAQSVFARLTTAKVDAIVRHYPDQDPQRCKRFWESALSRGVTLMVKKSLGKYRKDACCNGICTLRFHDWRLRVKILTWINLWRRELIGGDWEYAYDMVDSPSLQQQSG